MTHDRCMITGSSDSSMDAYSRAHWLSCLVSADFVPLPCVHRVNLYISSPERSLDFVFCLKRRETLALAAASRFPRKDTARTRKQEWFSRSVHIFFFVVTTLHVGAFSLAHLASESSLCSEMSLAAEYGASGGSGAIAETYRPWTPPARVRSHGR